MKQMILLTFVFVLCSSASLDAQPRKVKAADLAQLIKTTDHPLILNFWATWCVPCVEELPYFQELAAAHSKDSVELILVSLDMKDDYPAKIDQFIRQRNVTATVWWLDEHDADYFCPLVDAKWSGSIPATLLVNPRKGYRRFFERQLSGAQLENAISDLL